MTKREECYMKLLIMCIILLAVGVSMLVFPEKVYSLTESWKSYSTGEPSGRYKFYIRFGGSACTLVGIIGAVIYLVI